MRDIVSDIREEYLEWIVELVHGEDYRLLLYHLLNIEYTWCLPMDENRAMDGESLRDRFIYETNYSDYNYPEEPCSVLEMIVGLATKMNDLLIGIEQDDRTYYWFWELLTNLDLDRYDDKCFLRINSLVEIDDILDEFLNCKYDMDGSGGLFPLKNPSRNQRNVEIWYQMSEYIEENYDFS